MLYIGLVFLMGGGKLYWAFLGKRIAIAWDSGKSIASGLAAFFLFGLVTITSISTNQPVKETEPHHWTAYANYNSQNANLAIDRRPDTEWTTNQPMKPEMFFQVDFGKPEQIERLTFSYHQPVDDYPTGYRIEFSNDGVHWTIVVPVDLRVFSDATEIDIPPLEAQYLRITQTGYGKAWWSIYEFSLYHPSWLPRAYQYPLLLLFFCGLVGSLLFLILSFWPSFRVCGRGILIGLIVTITVGFFLRVYQIQYHDLNVDEAHYLTKALAYLDTDVEWAKQTFNRGNRMTAILYLIGIRGIFKLCYVSTLAIRMMSAILGTLTILLVFVIWRAICSRKEACFEAFLAALILALFVLHICFSRDGHGQIQMTFFYLSYIFVTCKALTTYPRRKTWFCWSGILLFLGLFFQGSMVVAPIGILIFALPDAFLTRLKLPGWQKFDGKNYVFLGVSIFIFWAYLYYVLFLKGGFAEAEGWKEIAIPTGFRTFSQFMEFLKVLWKIFRGHFNLSWWQTYGFPHYLSLYFLSLAILGFGDMLHRCQKAELFMVIQPIFFCVMISALLTSVFWIAPHYERFFHPFALTMACTIARGITVVSKCFRKPGFSIISRIALSTIAVCSFGFISISGIFLKQPKSGVFPAYLYRVYSGRKASFYQLIKYIKQSERGSNSIIITDPWWAFHYANTFNLNIKFLERQDLFTLIHDQREQQQALPIFIIVTMIQQDRADLIEALEERYNVVATSISGDSLYELRKNDELSVPVKGFSRHAYELRSLQGNNVVIDHVAKLMWQQSGASEPMRWGEAHTYIHRLNQENYAGYSDWRLPTIEELATLIESTQKNGELYIDPVFNPKQRWCWSADLVADSTNTCWIAHFYHGNVTSRFHDTVFYVRAVRTFYP